MLPLRYTFHVTISVLITSETVLIPFYLIPLDVNQFGQELKMTSPLNHCKPCKIPILV